jgi:hypothetical protein
MLLAASEAGLDFLGTTDHNNVAHQLVYGPGGDGLPIVIPGVEVTTYGGHWNAWGTDRWWEFREPESKSVERTMRAAAGTGAVVSVCHPKPFGPPWEYATAGGFHAVEVWNGPWPQLNTAALAHWEELLRRGARCVAVGGSDTHYLKRGNAPLRHQDALGTPTTWVHIDGQPTVRAILGALREGRSFVSESPRGPQLYVEPDRSRAGRVSVEARDGTGGTLMLLSDSGPVGAAPVNDAAWDHSFDVPAGVRYVRAQLVAASGDMRALTNPIWADQL